MQQLLQLSQMPAVIRCVKYFIFIDQFRCRQAGEALPIALCLPAGQGSDESQQLPHLAIRLHRAILGHKPPLAAVTAAQVIAVIVVDLST